MSKGRHVILLDSAPQKNWNFSEILSDSTGMEWEIVHSNSYFSDARWLRILRFFTFSYHIFCQRKDIDDIISWQQFYGLVYAFYCKLFHVRRCNRLIVMTFIYRPKRGLVGKLYYRFMRGILHSGYIDCIICFSSTEPAYYRDLFDTPEGFFCSVPFGTEDTAQGEETTPEQPRFILAPGKSNRDYAFLAEALRGTAYSVRILSDAFEDPHIPNITVYHDVFGQDYLHMLAKAYCVIVPLHDAHISAGQFVFLQAMMYGKPVIVTRSESVYDYIEDGVNGFVVEKTKENLLERLEYIWNDQEQYHRMAQAGRQRYDERFSVDTMAKAVARICIQ